LDASWTLHTVFARGAGAYACKRTGRRGRTVNSIATFTHGTPKVGFYGCSMGRCASTGEVVRLMLSVQIPKGRRYPTSLHMNPCPACGHSHTVNPFWRAYSERVDAGKEFITVEWTPAGND